MSTELGSCGEGVAKHLDSLVDQRHEDATTSLENFKANESVMEVLSAGLTLDELAKVLREKGFSATANTSWTNGRIETQDELERHPKFVLEYFLPFLLLLTLNLPRMSPISIQNNLALFILTSDVKVTSTASTPPYKV